jgi:hypothetical protein
MVSDIESFLSVLISPLSNVMGYRSGLTDYLQLLKCYFYPYVF